MNNKVKKAESHNKIKDILFTLGLLIVSIFLCIVTIKRIKYFSYKEIEATLVSYSEIRKNTEYDDTCTGTFEYYVDGKKYETSFSISHYNCRKGYRQTIYYDANNPQNSSGDRSITILLIVSLLDIFAIGGLFVMIKDLFKSSIKPKVQTKDNKKITKQKENNHSVYGNYEITYDSNDASNKYGIDDTACLEIIFEKIDLGYLNSELDLHLPKEKVDELFEDNQINRVLDSFDKMSSKYINDIMDTFVNQEINNLSKWYNVPNSTEGKKLIKERKKILVNGFKIDKYLNIIKINCLYTYSNDDVITVKFRYNIKNKKVENVDIIS